MKDARWRPQNHQQHCTADLTQQSVKTRKISASRITPPDFIPRQSISSKPPYFIFQLGRPRPTPTHTSSNAKGHSVSQASTPGVLDNLAMDGEQWLTQAVSVITLAGWKGGFVKSVVIFLWRADGLQGIAEPARL